MKRIGAMCCALAAVVLIGVTSLHAQITAEGSIRGRVKDEQGGVLPGVTITATTASATRPVTVVTDGEGGYRLANLPPGDYTLIAELAGFSKFSRSGLSVRAGLNITVDIALQVGSLDETVQVIGETPMLETEKSTQAVNISGDLQRALPLGSRRDFTDFLEVTPGVTARSFDQGAGGQVYMLRGTDIENHVTQVDGADMGSFRQNWAGQYTGLSTEAVDDVQVKTGGADASSPLGVGVVMNIATPSGTNVLKGATGVAFTARGWNGNNAAPGESPAIVSNFMTDVSAGGPIARDRAWFFGAFRYARRDTGIARDQKQLADLKGLVPSFNAFDNQSRNEYYYVKGTAQLSPQHQVYAFYQFDRNPDESNWAYNGQKLDVTAFGGNGVGSRLTSIWGQSATTKVLVAYNDKSINGVPGVWDKYPGQGPSRQVYDSAFLSAGRLTGSGFLAQLDNLISRPVDASGKLTLSADLTWYKRGWGGSHEFQTGVYLQPVLKLVTTTTYANGGFAQEDVVLRQAGNAASGVVPFRRRIYDQETLVTRDTMAKDYAFYVQDGWKPNDRLTINAGIRFDRVSNRDRLFNVMVQDAWEIGPRFGTTYVLTKSGHDVVRAGWGRVHDVPNAFYLGTAGSNTSGYRDEYDNNLDGVFETVLAQPASSRISSDRQIDPDRHQPFIDEWLVGYRRQFPGQLSLDVSLVNRAYKDRPALVGINGIYNGSVFAGYRDVTQNEIYLVTNNKWNWFQYRGLEFTVSKRTPALQLLGSVTRNWQHIEGTWQPNDPASFIQPSAFPNDKGLGTIRGNVTNSLAGDADIRSPSWQKYGLRMGGAYVGPWGLVLSSNLSLMSGPYSGPVVKRIAAPDPQFGPPTVVLSNGRVVSNPLATTVRFAYDNRGDGQVKAPNFFVWSLRMGKDFRFGPRKLQVAFDIFNLTNADAYQQFKTGGNQIYSPNFAIKGDGTFQGQSRQFARAGQLSVRFQF